LTIEHPHRPRKGQAARGDARAALKAGEIDILVGTHALFQESVQFRDLGLAVVDEQHRFGVHQRLLLSAKGTAFRHAGDDRDADPAHAGADRLWRHGCLQADDQAAGPPAGADGDGAARRLDEVVERAAHAIAQGQKIYWICPLVEENEELKVASAEERFAA
jgi:ATP-dependent DNA helicase RecG